MKKAIVTLAIGERHERIFSTLCSPLWTQYAAKHGFDLIVIRDPLDTSPRAKARSVAWQKCLTLSHEAVRGYDRVVWIDSDILINPESPDICATVPPEMIGAADAYSLPSREEHRRCLEILYQDWERRGTNFIKNLTPTEYHRNYGFEGEFEGVVQTGVLVLNPARHRELLEHVYYTYEEKGSAAWHYEMRPLSYEVLTHRLASWISPKFNMPWVYVRKFLYPFLDSKSSFFERLQHKLGIDPRRSLTTKCATTAFLNNYFLHFSGNAISDMKYVDSRTHSILDIAAL